MTDTLIEEPPELYEASFFILWSNYCDLKTQFQDLKAERDKAVDALEAVRDMKERPYEGAGLDNDAIDNCLDCQRYKNHPIQAGICDTHRKPLYARKNHEAHEDQALGPRCSLLARELEQLLSRKRGRETADDQIGWEAACGEIAMLVSNNADEILTALRSDGWLKAGFWKEKAEQLEHAKVVFDEKYLTKYQKAIRSPDRELLREAAKIDLSAHETGDRCEMLGCMDMETGQSECSLGDENCECNIKAEHGEDISKLILSRLEAGGE